MSVRTVARGSIVFQQDITKALQTGTLVSTDTYTFSGSDGADTNFLGIDSEWIQSTEAADGALDCKYQTRDAIKVVRVSPSTENEVWLSPIGELATKTSFTPWTGTVKVSCSYYITGQILLWLAGVDSEFIYLQHQPSAPFGFLYAGASLNTPYTTTVNSNAHLEMGATTGWWCMELTLTQDDTEIAIEGRLWSGTDLDAAPTEAQVSNTVKPTSDNAPRRPWEPRVYINATTGAVDLAAFRYRTEEEY